MHDALVVGGGPAGLSAALLLGRCRRSVLVVDAGRPRNRGARAIHGLLGCDGIAPDALLARAHAQLAAHPEVEVRRGEVLAIARTGEGFGATLADGGAVAARTVLLATGLRDHPPAWPGVGALWGVSVHHCPHCDAWEWRDRPLAALGADAAGVARGLAAWSRDVVWCSDGGEADAATREGLAAVGVRIEPRPLRALEGREGRLERIVLADGAALARDAAFVATHPAQASPLAAALGCRFLPAGTVDVGRNGETGVDGVWVAGDASRDAQLVVVAAAQGALAGLAIDKALPARG